MVIVAIRIICFVLFADVLAEIHFQKIYFRKHSHTTMFLHYGYTRKSIKVKHKGINIEFKY